MMAVKVKGKLYRNLKAGDKIQVITGWGIHPYREAVVTVSSVQRAGKAWFTGKRQWAVYGDYPWWFPGPITAYANERTEVL